MIATICDHWLSWIYLERLTGSEVLIELLDSAIGDTGRVEPLDEGYQRLVQVRVQRFQKLERHRAALRRPRSELAPAQGTGRFPRSSVVAQVSGNAEGPRGVAQFLEQRFDVQKSFVEVRPGHGGRQGDGDVNEAVQRRPLDGADEERPAAERMADVAQLLLARGLQDVIDDGRYIVLAHLVPTDRPKNHHHQHQRSISKT